jgi:hypothetical protein
MLMAAVAAVIITRWFKYHRNYLCVNKSQFVLVIFEPLCIMIAAAADLNATLNFRDWL